MKIANKRAFYDYEISDRLEAGINLIGAEVKAVRLGHVDLNGSYVKIIGNEAYLINARIFPYEYAKPENYDEKRTRKLLLHKKEILALKNKTDGANLAIIPISFYVKNDFIKIELGIGKGKKKYEKRASIKAKDIKRQIQQEVS